MILGAIFALVPFRPLGVVSVRLDICETHLPGPGVGDMLRSVPGDSMAADDFGKALTRRRQISITVTSRRSGRAIRMPVWFVSDDHAIWLLPVYGPKTQWCRNLMKNRAITVQAGRSAKTSMPN